MKLKKLTIIGFKSFADKIGIDFDCDIIGIVGPNGCGKSNIVDAFRWVLGEQSAKSLRGDKMHDVLFAGSDHRKPLNFAEVSVTLANDEGELPIAYQEVMITRRLYRSGESEYLINRQPVRLKDIQDLFLGTGIGKNAFSVFEQGKLDQVIHLSPLERRSIFDQAAGIGRFLQRKKETGRKLSLVTENYTRLRDVHEEVEKQTKQLKKQAAQAKHYQDSKIRLEQLERAFLVTRLRTLSEKNCELENSLHAISEEIKTERHRLAASEENLELIKKGLKEKEGRVKASSAKWHQAETQANIREMEIKQEKQKVAELQSKIEDLKGEKEAAILEQKNLLKQISDKEAGLIEAKHKKDEQEKQVHRDSEAYGRRKMQMDELKKELKAARENHLVSMQAESRIQQELQEKKLALQAQEQRLIAVEERLKEKKETHERLEAEKREAQQKVQTLSDTIDALKSDCESSENCFNQNQKSVEEQQKAIHECQKKLAELSAREQVLIKLKESCEGFSSGAKQILKEPKFKGKVKGLFEVLQPDETVMPAFHPYSQTLVVSTKNDFESVIAFAEKKNLTDFSVLLLTGKTFLEEIPIQASLEKAYVKGGECVTQEGYYIDNRGVVFRFNPLGKEGNPFLRETELNSLKSELASLEAHLEKLKVNLEDALGQLKASEKARKDAFEKRQKQEMSLIQENFSLQRLIADMKKVGQEENALEKHLRDFEHDKTGCDDISGLVEKLELQKAQTAQCLESYKKCETKVESEEKTLQLALKNWQEGQSVFQKAMAHWQSRDQECKLLHKGQEQTLQLIEKIDREQKQTQTALAQVVLSLENHIQQYENEKMHLLEYESSTQEEEQGLLKARAKREEVEKTLAEKRSVIGSLEKKRHQLEVLFAEDASKRKSLEQQLFERHQLSPEEIDSVSDQLEKSLEEAEKEIRELRVSLDRAGAVNMTAIEEYQNQAQRFQELDRQLVDLEEAKTDLEKIIGKLDGESRKIFRTTFEKIRTNFQKNFSILFNGGEANLAFTDSSDVLEAGIEIVAKPPGKQMRSISLLSGGEKCLTALALLFSIFEVRPAPFCILDEVDAPLDDSNIDRFTGVLKQYISKTQFIIVTHNKKTMSIADLLLGVSMEEKGVSKLLSLSLAQPSLAEKR